MTTIAIRRNAVQALTGPQRVLLRHALRRLELGDPADYTASGTRWLVWDDSRLELDDAALLGCLMANLASTATYDDAGRSREQIRDDLREALRTKLKSADTITIPDGADPWTVVLQANGAPPALRIGAGIPAGWTAT